MKVIYFAEGECKPDVREVQGKITFKYNKMDRENHSSNKM
jgi:hypothetical protein